jgi:N-methylhydantoinase A
MASAAQVQAVRLAVDVGGTFTDVVLEAGGIRHTHKVLTTPRAPEQAIIDGTRTVLDLAGITFADIAVFIHGTTLATNAIIERKGARTALIATDGFRDVLEIADESRFDQYDINIVKTQPLVSRDLRFTVPERIDAYGAVRLPLDEAAVQRVALGLTALGIESVAVALMHAYANADHEQRIGAILAQECPNVSVTLSSEVCPEAREYERTSTAVANAYVRPLMAGYLGRLQSAMASLGYREPIHLMTSGGSLASLDTATRYPIRLVESGPAGGAILAGRLALERGEHRVLSFDMGGTTAKICLIDDGIPRLGRTFEIDRQSRFKKGSGSPVRIPAIEMVEIGAGGGSIARVDSLKRILVGPDSAGAEPGPACYPRGGSEPTVTDADLVLGKIDPATFAGGRIALDLARAEIALQSHVGDALSKSAETAAYGVSEIVDENMSNAARVHAVERGAAVADRTLIAFGGAAPLHASRLAEKLGIARIIVPADAGVGSALGFLAAPAAYEQVRSRYMRLDRFDLSQATALLDDMQRHATDHCRSAAGTAAMTARRVAFMRYAGQGHEIAIKLPDGPLPADTAAQLRQAFEADYSALFARHIPGAAIEIMSWMVTVSTSQAPPAPIPHAIASRGPKPIGERDIYDTRLGRRLSVPLVHRTHLAPGMQMPGPMVVVEAGTATYVSPSFDLSVDSGHALVLTAKT